MTIQRQIMDLVKQLNQEERTELLYEMVVSKGNNVLGFRLDTFEDLMMELSDYFDGYMSVTLPNNGKKWLNKVKEVAMTKKINFIAEYCDEDYLYRCDCRDINCPDTILQWIRFDYERFIADISKEVEAIERDEKLETILNGN